MEQVRHIQTFISYLDTALRTIYLAETALVALAVVVSGAAGTPIPGLVPDGITWFGGNSAALNIFPG